jgi:cob(I)alamin adenosyltransferase
MILEGHCEVGQIDLLDFEHERSPFCDETAFTVRPLGGFSQPWPRVASAAVVKIYTRKGDDGTTGLWYGGRVPKFHGRPEAYGSIDEAAAALGAARAATEPHSELHDDILRIQSELFVAGAELATAPEAAYRLEEGISKITPELVERLESDIDRYMARVDLPPKFVIPGGTELSARLDVARTAVRRAERRVAALDHAGELADRTVLMYLNRLSDALFAMARFADEPEPQLFEGRL